MDTGQPFKTRRRTVVMDHISAEQFKEISEKIERRSPAMQHFKIDVARDQAADVKAIQGIEQFCRNLEMTIEQRRRVASWCFSYFN